MGKYALFPFKDLESKSLLGTEFEEII